MHIEDALQAVLRAKRAAGKSKRTLEWYERHLQVWIRWLAANGVDGEGWLSPEALEAFIEHERGRNLSDNTIDAYWRSLRVFFAG